MTDNNHPITPPVELMEKWARDAVEAAERSGDIAISIATKSARWGADMELEACCEELEHAHCTSYEWIRAARRPNPPSLKVRALAVLSRLPIDPEAGYCPSELDTIRLALESLPD